jgi:cleavage stimulation factor subunit 2
MTCTDSISRTLNTLPPAQLLDTLQQVQQFAVQDPARLTELFNQSPQLTYAIFQAMLLMGLVSPDAINSVLDNPGAPLPAPTGGAPPYGYPGATGTPPVAVGSGYGPPPVVPSPIPAPAPPAPAAGGQDPEALMRAVMELPQETIDQLPEAERQQIMALRASFGMQQRH